MMTIPTYLLIEATPNPDNEQARETYLSKAPAVVKEHGGVPVAKYDIDTVLDNDKKPGAFIVISFPNRDSIKNLFDDPNYQKLIPIRNQAFSSIRFFVCNEPI